MEWVNINVSTLDSAQFKGSEPVDRATWLCLMRYCVGQENGGRIVGASSWSDRKWQQLCGVTLREVRHESELWRWEGEDVVIGFYFLEKEAEVQRLRGQASAAANARWKRERNATTMPDGNALGDASRMPEGMPSGNAEEKRIEGKGREGREAATPIPFSGGGKIETASLLASFGLPCSKTDVAEWRGGLSKVARCRSEGEARTFIAWAIEVCRQNNVVVEHWRHVRQLALEWDAGQRGNHWRSA